jgi:hypothetical protein
VGGHAAIVGRVRCCLDSAAPRRRHLGDGQRGTLAIIVNRTSWAQSAYRQSVPPTSPVPTKTAEQEYHHYDDQECIRIHIELSIILRRHATNSYVDRDWRRCNRCFEVLSGSENTPPPLLKRRYYQLRIRHPGRPNILRAARAVRGQSVVRTIMLSRLTESSESSGLNSRPLTEERHAAARSLRGRSANKYPLLQHVLYILRQAETPRLCKRGKIRFNLMGEFYRRGLLRRSLSGR